MACGPIPQRRAKNLEATSCVKATWRPSHWRAPSHDKGLVLTMSPVLETSEVGFGSRSYGDGGKGLAPLSLCKNRWRCPHDPS